MSAPYARFTRRNALTLARLSSLAYRKQNRARIAAALDKDHKLSLVSFIADARTDTQGFIAENSRCIVIAFRGSESAKDLVTDLGVAQTRLSCGTRTTRVHRGFNRAYNAVRTRVSKTALQLVRARQRPIIVTGHSLGGALATLCAVSLAREARLRDLTVYTFGSPRVGNRPFASLYNRTVPGTYRVRNQRDIVTTIPSIGYKHVGTKKNYSARGRLLKKNPGLPSLTHHKLGNYIKTLSG